MRNPALLPRVSPAIVKDLHAPLSTVRWAGPKDDHLDSDEKATFDLIATEFSTGSVKPEELVSFQEDRKSRFRISPV
jgi:hypothetical protein